MKKLITYFCSVALFLIGTYSLNANAAPPHSINNGHVTYEPPCGSGIVIDAPDEDCDVELPDGREFSCTCSYEYSLQGCSTVKSLTDIKDCEPSGGGKRGEPPIVVDGDEK